MKSDSGSTTVAARPLGDGKADSTGNSTAGGSAPARVTLGQTALQIHELLVDIIESAKGIKRGCNAAVKGLQTIADAYQDMRRDALQVVEELREALAG
jgi:hypothetical protein